MEETYVIYHSQRKCFSGTTALFANMCHFVALVECMFVEAALDFIWVLSGLVGDIPTVIYSSIKNVDRNRI